MVKPDIVVVRKARSQSGLQRIRAMRVSLKPNVIWSEVNYVHNNGQGDPKMNSAPFYLKQIVGTILGMLFLLTTAQAASFDCGKAASEVEKLICRDDELSRLDESLSKAYKNALDIPFAPDELEEEQRNWLTTVRNVCQDRACLKRVYEQLLKSLNLYAQEKMHTLCNAFQHHLNQPAGLIEYAIEEKEIEQDDFNFSIPNIDVDGDKIEDKILLFHTGSGSIIPADYDSVTLILSSTGEKFTVEMQRFYVIVYKAKYYIVASNVQGEKGPVFVDIKSMDRRGITQVCSYDCGLYGGSCARRRHRKEK